MYSNNYSTDGRWNVFSAKNLPKIDADLNQSRIFTIGCNYQVVKFSKTLTFNSENGKAIWLAGFTQFL